MGLRKGPQSTTLRVQLDAERAARKAAEESARRGWGVADSLHLDVREQRQRAEAAEAKVARLREALVTIGRTGDGGTIVATRSDGHACSWCRGLHTPCPVVTARAALKETEP